MFDKIIFLGMIFLLAFTPLAYGTTEPWSLVILQLGVLLLTLLYMLRMIFKEGGLVIPNKGLMAIFGLFAVFVFLQTVPLPVNNGARVLRLVNDAKEAAPLIPGLKFNTLSVYPYATWEAGLVLLTYLLTFYLVTCYFSMSDPRTPDPEMDDTKTSRLSKLAMFLVFFSFAVSVFGIIQYFTSNGKIYWFRAAPEGTVFGPFVNRNHYAGYMELTIPMALGLAFTRGIGLEKTILYVFMATTMASSVFLSLSRGGMLSFVGEVLFLAFLIDLTRGKRIISLKNLFLCVIILVLVSASLFWLGSEPVIDRLGTLVKYEDLQPQQGRLQVWRDTLKIAKDFPIAGTGLGTFPYIYPVYKTPLGDKRYNEAHNDYLQALSETGLIGVVLIFLFAILAVRSALRALRSDKDRLSVAVRVGAITSCFGLLLHSITDFNLQIPSNAFLFFVSLAIATFPPKDVKRKS
jgi:O-antigen ligase